MRRLYIISDLHLGGEYPACTAANGRGFRLCTRADAIVGFIDAVTASITGDITTELIINGDTVDFLAESNTASTGWSAFTADQDSAIAKFETIARRDKNVFDALNRFLDREGGLRILLGNHDIELSLPLVRRALHRALGLKPGHDFEFYYDGEAYVAGDVLIEHGNRYDAWNRVDFDALRRMRSLLSRGQSVPSQYRFEPPAGSEMVARVINPIKKDYSFVDLLKPEQSAVVPLLLVLEPGCRSQLNTVARLAYSTRKHGLEEFALPKFGGDIRSTGDNAKLPLGRDLAAGLRNAQGPASGESSAQAADEEALRQTVTAVLGNEAAAFLAEIDASSGSEAVEGREVASMGSFTRSFGLVRLLSGSTSKPVAKRMSALLQALRGIQDQESFEFGTESAAEYLNAARTLARGTIRHVVFGHTHRPKQVDLGEGRLYLNSGTWADVLKFPVEMLSLPKAEALASLTAFTDKMKKGDFSDWVLFDPGYVRIELDDSGRAVKADTASFLNQQLI